jgi:hypothetical protein
MFSCAGRGAFFGGIVLYCLCFNRIFNLESWISGSKIQQFEVVVLWFDLIAKFESSKNARFSEWFAWASPLFLGEWLKDPSSSTRLHLGIVPWEKFLPFVFSFHLCSRDLPHMFSNASITMLLTSSGAL